jgi:vacuolar iron transporter family protein
MVGCIALLGVDSFFYCRVWCGAAMHSLNGEYTPLVIKNEHHPVEDSFKAAVFGFSDGLTTSMNLVLGVALLHQTHEVVVFTGLAGLFAGASSMACGEWLSAQAERDTHLRELEQEAVHLAAIPHEEAAHMKGILLSYGLSGATADAVNADVAALPLARQVAFHGKFELGLGELEDGSCGASIRSAVAMWLCFVLGAIIPLLPWLLTSDAHAAMCGSVAGSAAGLVGVSMYQVRGYYRALPRAIVRQVGVTTAAVGLTVGFNLAFAT